MIGPLLDLIEAYWLIMIEQLSLKLSLSAPLNAAGAPQPKQFVHNYSI